MSNHHRRNFWHEAFAVHGSVTPYIFTNVVLFGLIATAISCLTLLAENYFAESLRLELIPFEIAGASLGLLLVLRTNAGYERWWEARKLWGGMVNQSRNIAISGLAYGPRDSEWQSEFVKWTACFSHASRCRLRGEQPCSEIGFLVGPENLSQIAKSEHMPSFVVMKLALLLHRASTQMKMDKFSFLQVDRERALLMDHIGGCERILNAPLPLVYSIKIRRLITLFLVTLPFALLHRLGGDWLVPLVTMLVAYPLLSLDQIGVELQNPFHQQNLGHLPLNEISRMIESNLDGFLTDDLSELENGDKKFTTEN